MSLNCEDWAINNGALFGLSCSAEDAQLIILPAPWDVTASYGKGTANGPAAVLRASCQVDLHDHTYGNLWRAGIAMHPINTEWYVVSAGLGSEVERYHAYLAAGVDPEDDRLQSIRTRINEAGAAFNDYIEKTSEHYLSQKKSVAVLGGEHSTPYGLVRALSHRHDAFGILQVDAHCDLRKAYEGFTHSHASILYNISETIPQVKKIVQAGVRDYCSEESEYIRNSGGKIEALYDRDLRYAMQDGKSFSGIVAQAIHALPEKVYVSFDMDGLDPKLCPGTGTPVPGGFDFSEALRLLDMLVRSGRTIIGFDLCEISAEADRPEQQRDATDAIAGSRMLFGLCNATLASAKQTS